MDYSVKWKETDGMDTKRIEELVRWFRTHDGQVLFEMDCDKYFVAPIMEAFGDDVDAILDYLDKMKLEDLNEISGIFEDIYGKFMTDEVYDALERLGKKLEKVWPQSFP